MICSATDVRLPFFPFLEGRSTKSRGLLCLRALDILSGAIRQSGSEQSADPLQNREGHPVVVAGDHPEPDVTPMLGVAGP